MANTAPRPMSSVSSAPARDSNRLLVGDAVHKRTSQSSWIEVYEMSVEPWLRGTLKDVDALRRQVLHALELAAEDLTLWCEPLSDAEMHARPFGLASVAYHLRHIVRSLDRLLTYAEGRQLSVTQLAALGDEMLEPATAPELFRRASGRPRKRALASTCHLTQHLRARTRRRPKTPTHHGRRTPHPLRRAHAKARRPGSHHRQSRRGSTCLAQVHPSPSCIQNRHPSECSIRSNAPAI